MIATLLILCLSWATYGQDFESEFVDAINAVRQNGCVCAGKQQTPVNEVSYNPVLSQSARRHAYDIRRQRKLNHFSRSGLNIGQRIQREGYSWEVVGENLAYGHESIPEVLAAWEESDDHCLLIMDGRFKEVGFAHLDNYWVLHFATPKS